jgi:nuclear GTP-binding protein
MTKTQTKRKTLRQKYKIKKKVAEHKRQQKKAAKKAKTLGLKKSKIRKDTEIPNSYPFKKEVLQALQTKKELEQEEKMEKKQAKKAERKRKRESEMMGAGSVEELQRRAQMKQMEYESKSELTAGDEEQSLHTANDGSRKAYFREFRKVVDESDVILEVLDARDPMGCRCLEIEKFIMQRDPNKRIVLVMNKIDLVPKENIQDWLACLRKNLPAIAFKSSTQQQNSKIGRVNKSVTKLSEAQLKVTQCIGADTLMKLLKNYTRNQNIKTSITVGVIGYPNVGKSSLINRFGNN